MVIRENSDSLEIDAVDFVPQELPSADDRELSVVAVSHGFTGQGFAWVTASNLSAFLTQLRELEKNRQGEAVLEGLSPGEFQIRIWSITRRGHVAVGGKIGKLVNGREAGPYLHCVEFGFEFDPTSLPNVLSGFQELAKGPRS